MAPLVLFAVALAVRVVIGALHADAAYPDSYYYVNVARALAAGEGLTVDYVWNFGDVGGTLPAEAVLPIPSHGHWMPLATLVQVPFIWLLGPTALASALPFWLIGAAAAPLTYAIGRDAGLGQRIALTGGLLAGVPAATLPFVTQPDNFALYMALGALALWLCVRAVSGARWAWLAGGVVVGLAALSRNDGLLLGVPFALAALAELRQAGNRRRTLVVAGTCAAGCLLVVGPWYARQLLEFGTLSPSAAGGRMLLALTYHDLYSAGPLPTLDAFLARGIGPLLASRLEGLVAALAIFALLPLAVALVPFALLGAWLRRRDPAFRPFLAFAAVFFAAIALLFAAHVPNGMFLHSAVALLPHTYLLVAVGVSAAVDWVAARRSAWNARSAQPIFAGGLVAVALLAGVAQTSTTVSEWRAVSDSRRALAPALRTLAGGEIVMSADPGAFRYLAGGAGIVTPYDPLPIIEEAARRYDARWLVLEQSAIVPALAPVLRGDARPAWISPALVEVRGGAATASAYTVASLDGTPLAGAQVAPASAAGMPELALYALCLTPDDDRCDR